MIKCNSNISMWGYAFKKGQIIEQIPPRIRRALSGEQINSLFSVVEPKIEPKIEPKKEIKKEL